MFAEPHLPRSDGSSPVREYDANGGAHVAAEGRWGSGGVEGEKWG